MLYTEMKRPLTYKRFHLGLHVVAYTLLLVPFILLLLPAFQPVMSVPIFSVRASSRSVLIGAQGICAQDDEGVQTCVARGYNDYLEKVPIGAVNQADVMLKTSNGPLLMGILALVGLAVGLIGHITLLVYSKSSLRPLKPRWRALTMPAANFLLLGLATWTLILGAVDLSNLIEVQRSLQPATQVGSEKGTFQTEMGFNLSMAAVAVAVVALMYVAVLTALWNDADGKSVALGNHFVVIEAQVRGESARNDPTNYMASEEDEAEMEGSKTPTDGTGPKKKKDLPMNEAIEVARQHFAQSAHPPKIAHEVGMIDDDDGDLTTAADGRPLQDYIDASGHKQREMISADISTSPTSDSQMPTPKELKDEDHPAAVPVWKGHDQIKPKAKAAQPAPDFRPAARPAFTSVPNAAKRKPSVGAGTPIKAVQQHQVIPITAVFVQPKTGKPAAIRFADDPVPLGKEAQVNRGRAVSRQKATGAARRTNVRVPGPGGHARKHDEPDSEPPSTPLSVPPYEVEHWGLNPRTPPAPVFDDLDREPLEPVAPLKLHRTARR